MNCRTIFHFIEFVKGTYNFTFLYLCFVVLPPPTKLELTLAGKAKEEQSWVASDTFKIADGVINGFPYWLKTDGNQAIWFDKVGSNWKVYDKSRLGENFGGITGASGKDSYPDEIKQGWRYAIPNNDWEDVGPNDIIFKAIGTFLKF